MRIQNVIFATALTCCLIGEATGQQYGGSLPFDDPNASHQAIASENSEIAFNEGILRYEIGDYKAALSSFQPLRSTNTVAAQYCDLCESQLGFGSSENECYDEQVGNTCASCYQDGPRDFGQPAPRPWNLTVLSGYQYDSNVGLSPDFVGLGSVTDKSDSSVYLAAFGDYRIMEKSDRNFGVVGSTYSNWYQNQSNFNLQDYMSGLYFNRVIRENVIGGVRYEYHRTFLNDDPFSGEHRLVPNISFLQGDLGHTTLFYEFDSRDFDGDPLIPALDPSGDTNAVGITRARYTHGGLGRLFAGYRFEHLAADGSDFDRDTHQVNARFEVPVSDRLIWDAGGRYFWDDYLNPNSLDFFGNARRDRRLEVRTGLQLIMTQHLSTRVDYTFTDSDSNVANLFGVRFYDYARHNLTAQMIIDF